MFEALLATAIMVGHVEVGPGIHLEQYLATDSNGAPVLVEFETDTE